MIHITALGENTELLVFEKGQQVIEQLTRHCKDKGIMNASFQGIGAVDCIECGYYDLANQSYEFSTYNTLCEVVGFMGNVMLRDGQPFVHAHGSFTDEQNNAFGGHINEMRVGATLEVVLHKYATTIERKLDHETGLHLIDLSGGAA